MFTSFTSQSASLILTNGETSKTRHERLGRQPKTNPTTPWHKHHLKLPFLYTVMKYDNCLLQHTVSVCWALSLCIATLPPIFNIKEPYQSAVFSQLSGAQGMMGWKKATCYRATAVGVTKKLCHELKQNWNIWNYGTKRKLPNVRKCTPGIKYIVWFILI